MLQTLNKPWLTLHCLSTFEDSIHAKGAALDFILGFVRKLKCYCGIGEHQSTI